jgi:hypothetical protein
LEFSLISPAPTVTHSPTPCTYLVLRRPLPGRSVLLAAVANVAPRRPLKRSWCHRALARKPPSPRAAGFPYHSLARCSVSFGTEPVPSLTLLPAPCSLIFVCASVPHIKFRPPFGCRPAFSSSPRLLVRHLSPVHGPVSLPRLRRTPLAFRQQRLESLTLGPHISNTLPAPSYATFSPACPSICPRLVHPPGPFVRHLFTLRLRALPSARPPSRPLRTPPFHPHAQVFAFGSSHRHRRPHTQPS